MKPRHFIGLGEEGEGIAIAAEGQKIGVLRSFKIDRSTPAHRVYHLPENVIYEVPKEVVYQLPISRIWVNEAWLRVTLLDAECNYAPPREFGPARKGFESGSNR